MKFHKEGYPTLLLVLVLVLILNAIAFFVVESKWLDMAIYIFSALLLITVLQFFRNPSRKQVTDDLLILSPADGKVVVIEEVEEQEYLKEKRRQISVFMSPVNIHMNRYPVGGVLEYFKYHPGKYLVAWHPKSSVENERTTAVVNNPKGKILFRQIAGALARRIVFYGKEGETVKQNEECGFIKFGSRVDVLIPLEAEVLVKIGDKVKGGITPLAKFKN
ncbi:MAG: phosphatidylserine decarboxylase family protein [Vicingaceae bacterium]